MHNPYPAARRTLALLLCAALLFALPLPAGAAGNVPYPESAHPYENGVTAEARYDCPGADRGLFVTFSDDTWVEPFSSHIVIVGPGSPQFTVGDLISPQRRSGDYVAVLDSRGNTVGTFSGAELAGKTVYVPDCGFRVLLRADAQNNGYGYRVTEVRPAGKDEVRRITYRAGGPDGAVKTAVCPRDGDARFLDGDDLPGGCRREGYAFSGWAAVPGGPVTFDPNAPIPAGIGDMDLFAVWTPLCLGRDEVLAFSNSGWYFARGEEENYYMSAEDYREMQLNLYRTYGLGPVPSPVLSAVLATYPDWEWQGSCYGMSTVVALQHFGLIDLLGLQGAASVSELQADDALISRINYYQSQAATSWLTENKAYVPGTAGYAAQLRLLYEAVADGSMALFTFYPGAAFVETGHTVLLTGAYTRADGSRVLIAYDCNDPWDYRSGDCEDRFVIAPDGKTVTDDWGDAVGAFNWTCEYSQFTPFAPEGEKASPLVWYRALLRHLLELFVRLRTALSMPSR